MERLTTTLGDGRFELLALLGSGAFGEVYRCRDRVDDGIVALKLLHKADPSSLLRFKGEFRAVADTLHPNLVRLFELHRDGARWFFTMELVPGQHLDTYVRPEGRLDEERVLSAFGQVARGLDALHASGQVHRDVKPSNVRVEPDGRAVLLDFGLAAPLLVAGDTQASGSFSEALLGSPYYMSPEQAAGEPPQPASDWYAFGVALYEGLKGELPFAGRPLDVLVQKGRRSAPPLGIDSLGVAELVERLLARDPDRRPRADEVLTFFERGSVRASAPGSTTFIGRDEELRVLEAAGRRVEGGEPATCWVQAPPGTGRTALIEHFRAGLPANAFVLHGRCYEQESVPYKGVDAAVDHLTRRLCRLPERELVDFDAARVSALVAAFPVLARVPSFASVHRNLGHEPGQLRNEAFAAFRELLALLARRRPVVFLLDDMQWIDADGAALLGELLRPPTSVPMLFVGALRVTGTERPPWLVELQREVPGTALALEPLSFPDSTDLARQLLGGASDRAERLARASGGSPLLLELLVRYGAAGSSDLEGAVNRCLDGLHAPERRLLEATCLAGHPVHRRVVLRASGTAADAASALSTQHLITVGRDGDDRFLAPYHDRIREVVVAQLDATRRRALHGALAAALVEHDGDPDAIAQHHRGAGDMEATAHWTIVAAERAERALAWDQAAQLYGRAILLRQGLERPVASLLTAQGTALGHMGHGAASAAAFERALDERGGRDAPRAQRVDLLQRKAEQLLRCGRMKQGVSTLEEALAVVGMRYPRRPTVALGRLLESRARLRLRGLEFEPRAEADVEPMALQRIDLGWSAGVGLSSIDSIRGAGFLSRSLLDALDAGEPYRVARSLAYEACFLANRGRPGEALTRDMIARTRALARDLDEPHVHALVLGATCLLEFHTGRWRPAVNTADEAVRFLRENSVGIVKEVATIQLMGLAARVFVGDFVELARLLPPILRAAETRGDLFALASKRSGFPNALWLAQDEVPRAREQARRATVGWETEGYVIQNFFDLWARTQIELYEGDGVAAGACLSAGWRSFRRSMLTRLPFLRACADDLAGRAALADTRDPKSLITAARRSRDLGKQKAPWATALATALDAGIAWRSHGPPAAEARLAEAVVRFEQLDMMSHAAAMLWARSRSARGRRAVNLEAEALRRFERCGIRNGERWTGLLFPAAAL